MFGLCTLYGACKGMLSIWDIEYLIVYKPYLKPINILKVSPFRGSLQGLSNTLPPTNYLINT